ncbi:uncharacterized protein LOC124122803 [Haliotis rufescens]|uniref:uncharacterized protein LOC124122803 n=1 Tax=Haliotis rufescens TaxID=6454 RepID=UPI00201F8147|nr:uncharacterized protein LOC124122803 [Haliotis rufescens]
MDVFNLQCALSFLLLGELLLPATCSVELTSAPSVATHGEPLTLTCNNTGEARDDYWFRNGDLIFFTAPSSSSLCDMSILNKDLYSEYLSGRVNVSCDVHQHNVTLTIDSHLDDGSVWWCVVEGESNNITIRMNSSAFLQSPPSLPTTPVSTSTPTSSLPTTSTSRATFTVRHDVSPSTSASRSTFTAKHESPYLSTRRSPFATSPDHTPPSKLNTSHTAGNNITEEHGKGDPDVHHFYLVAGSVCGAAVAIVLTAAILILWTKRRNTQKEESAAIMQSEETNHFYINQAVHLDVVSM